MLAPVGTLLASLSAGAVALFVLGCADVVGRRWRNGVRELVASVALVLIAFLCLGWAGSSLMRGNLGANDVGTEAKAHVLAESISSLMNVTALGLPFGLVAGVVLVWRRRVRAGAR